MLTLYTWSTQNARKISIMLEECALDYKITSVNILKDEQFSASFHHLNPNNKIPVLVDTDLCDSAGEPVAIFETGAILLYLAEKTGQFLSKHPAERTRTLNWLFWQTSGMGPVFGNFAHFASAMVKDKALLNAYLAKSGANEPVPYAIERFAKESFRLLGVLNQQLSVQDFIVGELSIADFAAYPWVESAWSGFKMLRPNIETDYEYVARWMADLSKREALQRGMVKLAWGVEL